MIAKQVKTTGKRPGGRKGSGLDVTDITNDVPNVEDTIDEVEMALAKAENLQEELIFDAPRKGGCGCGG